MCLYTHIYIYIDKPLAFGAVKCVGYRSCISVCIYKNNCRNYTFFIQIKVVQCTSSLVMMDTHLPIHTHTHTDTTLLKVTQRNNTNVMSGKLTMAINNGSYNNNADKHICIYICTRPYIHTSMYIQFGCKEMEIGHIVGFTHCSKFQQFIVVLVVGFLLYNSIFNKVMFEEIN